VRVHPPVAADGVLHGVSALELTRANLPAHGRELPDVDLLVTVAGDLHLRPGPPLARQHLVEGAGHGDQAVVQRHHAVAVVRAQPRAAVPVGDQPHAAAPAQRTAGQLFDLDFALDPGQPLQLLGDDAALELPLELRRRVLPVAAAAQSRCRDRARRLDPLGDRTHHPDGVGPAERTAVVLGDLGEDLLARQRVPDEHHPALHPGDAVAAMGHRPYLELERAASPVFFSH
jgi:hypothetical protein